MLLASIRRLFRLRYWPSRLALAFLAFLALDQLYPLPAPKPYSTIVLAADGSLLAAYLSPDGQWRMPTHLDEVSPELVQALIAKEDQWFYQHPGVNPFAIFRAGWQNLVQGRRVSGASTITMQVARMMERKPRTLRAKVQEVFRAFQLEWHHSKEDILEMYLSYLPYGGNVEGVKAASYLYLDRPPEQLSLAQAVMLTLVPNDPNRFRLDRDLAPVREARNTWLRRFGERGLFPAEDIRVALQEPIRAARGSIQPQAPHLSRRLAQEMPGQEIRSTIRPAAQEATEQLLRQYVRRALAYGISNGAVLVLDNETGEVIAYAGSADFSNDDASGQVDGVQAVRSPGSTLKPALYAMAMDLGLCTPDTRMLDIPSTWNGYSPDNYDELFRGPVSLADALRHSLNITAVSLLREVGFSDFADLLIASGMQTVRRQKDQLGLSLILGGCGATLEELVRLFSAFARKGMVHPLRYHAAQELPGPHRLFSEASAWLIQDILSGIERPDLPQQYLQATTRPSIAWKTGTSYGRRDAWSIGFTPRHTIGVWIGNFDGRGAPGLSGSTMAVPLLFEVFAALEKGLPKKEFPRPAKVYTRDICLETGLPPSPFCTHTGQGHYILDVSDRSTCSQEREMYISPDSSMRYCTGCLPPSDYTKAVYPVFPPGLTLWWEVNEVAFAHPPPHNPACRASFDGEGPQIISPSADFTYFLLNEGEHLLLQAASDSRVNQHFWFLDEKFVGKVAPGEKLFIDAATGQHTVTCMDDQGRRSQVILEVRQM